MDWTKIKEALKIEKEVTDENASEVINLAFTKLSEDLIKVQASLKTSEEVIAKAASAKEGDKETVNASLSADPLTVRLLSDLRSNQLNGLVASNKLTPALCKEMKAKYADKETVTLELQAGGKLEEFDMLIKVLEQNTPIKTGEHSGPQLLELSNGMDAGKGNANVMEKITADRAKQAHDLVEMSR